MRVILVDDEQLNLNHLNELVAKALPDASRASFSKASRAMEYIMHNPVDIAFLDIEMRGINGITLAQSLRNQNPKANILFCTGYSEYSLDAWNLDCSGYLLKPITEAKVRHALENLRYPLAQGKRVRFHCFGNFDAFCDGEPIRFKYRRTTEFLAYLVDRNGMQCSLKELTAVLFEEDRHQSYIYQLRLDLINTLDALGVGDILLQTRGHLAICKEKVECDYFDYLDGVSVPPIQEYMTQYSFGEQTYARLFWRAE